ncbi:MAG: hypothetical protein JW741_24005 [Sedimentisphaerales bacterium]|nr:hypothetical protein [Sedimentisphaerales bacterium]
MKNAIALYLTVVVLPAAGGFGGRIDPQKAEAIRSKGWDLTDPQYKDLYWNVLAGGTYEDFLGEWQAKVREVIDKYRPDEDDLAYAFRIDVDGRLDLGR